MTTVEVMTVPEVAEALEISETKARRLFSDRVDEAGQPGPLKRIPYLGRDVRTTRASFDRFLVSILGEEIAA